MQNRKNYGVAIAIILFTASSISAMRNVETAKFKLDQQTQQLQPTTFSFGPLPEPKRSGQQGFSFEQPNLPSTSSRNTTNAMPQKKLSSREIIKNMSDKIKALNSEVANQELALKELLKIVEALHAVAENHQGLLNTIVKTLKLD